MTLIETKDFHTITNLLGTISFFIVAIFTLWFASRMD